MREVLLAHGIINDPKAGDDPRKEAAKNLADAMTRPDAAAELIKDLFPIDIPTDQRFFDVLAELHDHVGYTEDADSAIGAVWVAATRGLPPIKQEEILNQYALGPDIFNVIGSLSKVLGAFPFSPAFLSNWYSQAAKRVESDMVQDGFWEAVRESSEAHQANALEILRLYLPSSDETRLHIAAFILGALRHTVSEDDEKDSYNQVEQQFLNHSVPDRRAVYFRSWITTAFHYSFNKEHIELLTSKFEVDAASRDTILFTLTRILLSKRLSADIFTVIREWVAQRISGSIERFVKFEIARVVHRLNSPRPKISDAERLAVNKWPIQMQPIPSEDRGTWNEIDGWLYEVAKVDFQQFSRLFEGLVTAGGSELFKVISQPRAFAHLLNGLASADVSELVGRLVTDADRESRRIGLFLFDELKTERLPDELFQIDGPIKAQILFYETQCSVHDPKCIARLLVAILPQARLAEGEFLSEFQNELELQLRNYSGECRAEVEKIAGSAPEVIAALKFVSASFEALRRARETGICSMQVPGWKRAAVLSARRMSNQVKESAEQYSVILKLFKKVQDLYGNTHGSFHDGKLMGPLPYAKSESHTEVPAVEVFDPESMAYRRLHALSRLRPLEERLTSKVNEENDE